MEAIKKEAIADDYLNLKELFLIAVSMICYSRNCFHRDVYKHVEALQSALIKRDAFLPLVPIVRIQEGTDSYADKFLENIKLYVYPFIASKTRFTVYLVFSSKGLPGLNIETEHIEKIYAFEINSDGRLLNWNNENTLKTFFIKLMQDLQSESKTEESNSDMKCVQVMTQTNAISLNRTKLDSRLTLEQDENVKTLVCSHTTNLKSLTSITSKAESLVVLQNGDNQEDDPMSIIELFEKETDDIEDPITTSQVKIDSELESFLQPTYNTQPTESTQPLEPEYEETEKQTKITIPKTGLREIKNQNNESRKGNISLTKPKVSSTKEIQNNTNHIGCECGDISEEQDMFQCDSCKGWVHCYCYGFESDSDPRQPSNLLCYTCLLSESEPQLYDRMTVLTVYRRAIQSAWVFGYEGAQKLAKRLNCNLADARKIETRMINEGILNTEKGKRSTAQIVKTSEMVDYLKDKYFSPSRWIAHLNFKNYRRENRPVYMKSFLSIPAGKTANSRRKRIRLTNDDPSSSMKPLRI
ncbi:linear element associated protein Hop1 [Schizosaccharomyces cryophilus OY26]|uniref:Linear element associated protein Hop1 n=1 Tax=Schizosaccharomyces cryophilus (strain OY26 / ATCC MYA-4695 / CBS 11777 / NBRC 106824 / NRRL Y48691) TaxID=653667 RepID=S9W777_SCHCR|nr:linear element associated protein Hop1 [Schizosaccharomyces cryophilus OY26]EPY53750.1 linear element associated protein Hop1 [Schizosaccharomyces cryophilus OY26]